MLEIEFSSAGELALLKFSYEKLASSWLKN
jgi:hypothetical protein